MMMGSAMMKYCDLAKVHTGAITYSAQIEEIQNCYAAHLPANCTFVAKKH
jgi:hypothetical protein